MTATTNLIRSSCAVASNKKVELISRSAQPFFVRWIQIQKPLQSSPKKLSFSGAMKTVRFFTIPFVAAFALLQPAKAVAAEAGKYLFILSGQSNMRGHRPDEAFTPAVKAALGDKNVIVVQDAMGGQPIQRWWKDWKSPEGEKPKTTGDLYDRLMSKVRPQIKGQKLASVTFIWMQGERDAKMRWGKAYEASLKGLHEQLGKDLGRKDVNFVIGRLSDFDMKHSRYQHWTMVRELQVKVADSNPRFSWVNTDDLNDGVNRRGKKIKDDLHNSAEGYKTLGKRFAASALKLIQRGSDKK